MKNTEYQLMSGPLAINWNYSYKCPLNCTHCYSRDRAEKELLLSEKYKVADNIIRNKIFIVNIGGGEPICSEGVNEIIHLLRLNNIYVSLSTNGWFIDDIIGKKIADAKLNQISISIDHSTPKLHDINRGKEGCYMKALHAVKIGLKYGIKVVFSTTIASYNYEDLENIVELANNLGIYGVDFKRLKTMGNAANRTDLELNEVQKNRLYSNLKRWRNKYPNLKITLVYSDKKVRDIDGGCPCGKISLCISSNGNILPCVYNNSVVLGNALNDDLGDIWRNSPKLLFMRENYSCMGLMKRKKMKKYNINNNIIYQKDYRIPRNMSTMDYILTDNADTEIKNGDSTVLVISIDEEIYEVNLIGTIIFEMIVKGEGVEEIFGILRSNFDVEEKQLIFTLKEFINDMLQLNIIQEVK